MTRSGFGLIRRWFVSVLRRCIALNATLLRRFGERALKGGPRQLDPGDSSRSPLPLFEPLEPRVLLSAVPFAAPTSFAFGEHAGIGAVEVADFNGDGIDDWAASTYTDSAYSGDTPERPFIRVALNDGSGEFPARSTVALDSSESSPPAHLAAGDVNGDGDLDIAARDNDPDDVSIFLNQGGGEFSKAGTVTGDGLLEGGLALRRMNGDEHADLLVTSSGELLLAPSNGDGSFGDAQVVSTVFGDGSFEVAELTGDSHLDVVGASAGELTLLPGNGDGTFGTAQSLALSREPADLAVGDLDGDEAVDIGVSHDAHDSSGSVTLLINDGGGTFGSRIHREIGGTADEIAFAELTGDGRKDVVAAGAEELRVMRNTGGGQISEARRFFVGRKQRQLTVGNFDDYAGQDLAVLAGGDSSSEKSQRVVVAFDRAGNAFGAERLLGASGPTAVGDIDGDGVEDIVAVPGDDPYSTYPTGQPTVFLGNGDGTFEKAGSATAGAGPAAVAVDDLNGDGFDDVVVANADAAEADGRSESDPDSLSILRGNSDGSLTSVGSMEVPADPRALTLGDLDGDGVPDLGVSSGGSDSFGSGPPPRISIFRGDDGASFSEWRGFSLGAPGDGSSIPGSLEFVDVNGDGLRDVLSVREFAVDFSMNRGGGQLSRMITPGDEGESLGSGASVAIVDVDGDGVDDLIRAKRDTNSDLYDAREVVPARIAVRFGKEDALFGRGFNIRGFSGQSAVAAMEITDQRPSTLVVSHRGQTDDSTTSDAPGAISVLDGGPHGSFAVTQQFEVLADRANTSGPEELVGPSTIIVRDLDGNGHKDLILGRSKGKPSVILDAADRAGMTNAPPQPTDDGGAGFSTTANTTLETASVLSNDGDPDGDDLSVTGLDTSATAGEVTQLDGGRFEYAPSGAFDGLAEGETALDTFSYTVSDGEGATATATVRVTVTGASSELEALDFEGSSEGASVKLSRDLDVSTLVGQPGDGSASVNAELRREAPSGGPGERVSGSWVFAGATNRLRFVPTGDGLDAGTYTLTLASGDGGLVDTAGNGLTEDVSRTFEVSEPSGRVVKVPGFSREAGQTVAVPASSGGLPVTIADGAGVRSVDLTLRYDGDLLEVSGASPASGLPENWQVAANLEREGVAELSVFGPEALTSSDQRLISLSASVASGASAGDSGALSVTSVSVNEGAISARGVKTAQQVALLGDASGDGNYSGFDASLIARNAVGLDEGFAAHPRTAAPVLGDISGDGSLSGFDASLVARQAVGLEVPEIPDPGGSESGSTSSVTAETTRALEPRIDSGVLASLASRTKASGERASLGFSSRLRPLEAASGLLRDDGGDDERLFAIIE